ncbi:MAG: hypothetical protein JSS82_03625 [Bacteroidetes bacterium]|nr:hypothetical protein [Bacteroidota bacterium]
MVAMFGQCFAANKIDNTPLLDYDNTMNRLLAMKTVVGSTEKERIDVLDTLVDSFSSIMRVLWFGSPLYIYETSDRSSSLCQNLIEKTMFRWSCSSSLHSSGKTVITSSILMHFLFTLVHTALSHYNRAQYLIENSNPENEKQYSDDLSEICTRFKKAVCLFQLAKVFREWKAIPVNRYKCPSDVRLETINSMLYMTIGRLQHAVMRKLTIEMPHYAARKEEFQFSVNVIDAAYKSIQLARNNGETACSVDHLCIVNYRKAIVEWLVSCAEYFTEALFEKNETVSGSRAYAALNLAEYYIGTLTEGIAESSSVSLWVEDEKVEIQAVKDQLKTRYDAIPHKLDVSVSYLHSFIQECVEKPSASLVSKRLCEGYASLTMKLFGSDVEQDKRQEDVSTSTVSVQHVPQEPAKVAKKVLAVRKPIITQESVIESEDRQLEEALLEVL